MKGFVVDYGDLAQEIRRCVRHRLCGKHERIQLGIGSDPKSERISDEFPIRLIRDDSGTESNIC